MKNIILVVIIALVVSIGCDMMEKECDAGDMRCHHNRAQMCSADELWEDYQDCSAIGDTCSADCGGYTGITCCL